MCNVIIFAHPIHSLAAECMQVPSMSAYELTTAVIWVRILEKLVVTKKKNANCNESYYNIQHELLASVVLEGIGVVAAENVSTYA